MRAPSPGSSPNCERSPSCWTQRLRAQCLERFEATRQAAELRLRPRLMITLPVVLGFTPLAFALKRGGELLRPMAAGAIGGLLAAILMALYLAPVLYKLIGTRDSRVDALGVAGRPVGEEPARPPCPTARSRVGIGWSSRPMLRRSAGKPPLSEHCPRPCSACIDRRALSRMTMALCWLIAGSVRTERVPIEASLARGTFKRRSDQPNSLQRMPPEDRQVDSLNDRFRSKNLLINLLVAAIRERAKP